MRLLTYEPHEGTFYGKFFGKATQDIIKNSQQQEIILFVAKLLKVKKSSFSLLTLAVLLHYFFFNWVGIKDLNFTRSLFLTTYFLTFGYSFWKIGEAWSIIKLESKL